MRRRRLQRRWAGPDGSSGVRAGGPGAVFPEIRTRSCAHRAPPAAPAARQASRGRGGAAEPGEDQQADDETAIATSLIGKNYTQIQNMLPGGQPAVKVVQALAAANQGDTLNPTQHATLAPLTQAVAKTMSNPQAAAQLKAALSKTSSG